MLARKAVTFVNVSTVPLTRRSPFAYGDMRTTNHLSPSRKSVLASTPLAMTSLHWSSRLVKPARREVSRDARPTSAGERRSSSAVALLKPAIVKSRCKTTIGTSTASRMLVRSVEAASASSPLRAPKPIQPLADATGGAATSGSPGSDVQLAAALEDGMSNRREKLTQCQQQRLGTRHVERRPVAGEQLVVEDTGLVRADCLAERVVHGVLQPSVVLHWNEVRVIRPEPGQHARVDVFVEVVHQERAEGRHVVLFDQLSEGVLEVHAGVDVPALPEDIHHFSPDAHFLVTPCIARLCDDVFEDAREYVGIRHRVTHEAGEELVGVDDCQLSAFPRRSHIDALVLEVCVKAGPVWGR